MRSVFSFVFALFFAGAAVAAPFTFVKGGLNMDVPDGWKTQQDGDSLQLSSADDAANLTFQVVPAAGVEAALDELEKSMKSLVKGAKLGKPEAISANGIAGVVADGAGTIEGVEMHLALVVLDVAGPNAVIILGMVPKILAKQHDAAVSHLLGSFKPAK